MGCIFTGVHIHIKHKAGTQNKVVDALSRKTSLLATLRVKVIGFDLFLEIYIDDSDFGKIWADAQDGLHSDYMIHDGFLFRGSQLCIPNCLLRDSIIMELTCWRISRSFWA